MGFGLIIGFIELLRLVTTSKDYALTVLHASQITIGHSSSSQSVTIFPSRCLVAASNSGRYASSRFPNCPRPQLPASHSNSSQRLNTSSYVINSVNHQPTQLNAVTDQLTPLHSTPLHSTPLSDWTHFSLTVLLITSRHVPHRKHLSFVALYGPLSSYLFRGGRIATALRAVVQCEMLKHT
jgi:hypothetical protein